MHAFAAPSSAARWMVCAAAPTLEARAPDSVSSEAAEGTAAHFALEQVLSGHTMPDADPAGTAITQEMRDAVEEYRSFTAGWPPAVYGATEHWVPSTGIDPQGGGTPDDWRYFDDQTLTVLDLKFGFRPVSAVGNWQLLYYAAAICATYGLTPQRVTLIVFQPRNYRGNRWSEWTISYDQLLSYADQIRERVGLVYSFDPPATVNPECRDCKGRHLCPALAQAAYRIADTASINGVADPTLPQLGAEFAILKAASDQLSARLSGIEAEIESHIKQGHNVPGVRVERTSPGRKWSLPDDVVIQMLGPEYAKPPAAVTPRQAEKAKADLATVEALSYRPPGSIKLVPDDGTAARQAFGKEPK